MGIENDYLLWKYRSPLPQPILYAALETIELNGNTFAWVTGGEETNDNRVYLTGAVKKTYLYNIQLDEWQESVNLLHDLSGHCMVKVDILEINPQNIKLITY